MLYYKCRLKSTTRHGSPIKTELRAAANMSHHPVGITVDIVGITSGDRGRSCEEHEVCGSILELDMVVRIKREQVIVDGREETALTVNWVSDGIDRCRVGFLRKALVKHHNRYNGRLAQITEIYTPDDDSPSKRRLYHQSRGCAVGTIIDYRETDGGSVGIADDGGAKKRKANEESSK